jgi:hypothetical protein
MTVIGMVVESYGDFEAFPSLVAKIGEYVGSQIYAPKPVKGGSYINLSRAGQIERFVELAASQEKTEYVVVAVDHDDGCAVETYKALLPRAQLAAAKYGKDVQICFCIREFEAWLLTDVDNLRTAAPEYPWDQEYRCAQPELIRDAKGHLEKAMGRTYKETIDQSRLVKKLNISALYKNSRSFRKFVKCVTGLDYDMLEILN